MEHVKKTNVQEVDDAMGYIEGLYGEEWRAKCEFPSIEGSALVCCSTGKGSFACALVLLLVKDKVDFSVMKPI